MHLLSSHRLYGKIHIKNNIKNNASLLTIALLFLAYISIYQNDNYSPQKQKLQQHQHLKVQDFWDSWKVSIFGVFGGETQFLQQPRHELSQRNNINAALSSNGYYRFNKSSNQLEHDQQYSVNIHVIQSNNAFDMLNSQTYDHQDIKQQQQKQLFNVDTSSPENQYHQSQMQHHYSNSGNSKSPTLLSSSNKNHIDNSYSSSTTSTVLVSTTSSSASSFPTEDPSWYGCQAECSIEYCNEYVDCSYNCRSVTFDDFAPTNCRLDNVCVCISER